MANEEHEWGPIIEHDGKGCPVPVGTYVRAWFSDGDVLEGVVWGAGPGSNEGQWDWARCKIRGWARIILYRIRKPRGLQALEGVLREVEREHEKGDA